MKRLSWILMLTMLVCVQANAQAVKLSPVQKVGGHTVRVAYVPTDMEWLGEQKYFLVDNQRVELPPLSLGYDRVFSFPRWVASGGRIVSLKYWQFDKENSKRRVVHLSYPGYRVLSRGRWASAPGGDTVPDPPR